MYLMWPVPHPPNPSNVISCFFFALHFLVTLSHFELLPYAKFLLIQGLCTCSSCNPEWSPFCTHFFIIHFLVHRIPPEESFFDSSAFIGYPATVLVMAWTFHPWGWSQFMTAHPSHYFAMAVRAGSFVHYGILALGTGFSQWCACVWCSVAQKCLTLCDPMDCSLPGFPVHYLLKLMSIESGMPSNHLILCHSLLLPSIFPSIRVFVPKVLICFYL